jgi:hypothetical protein
VTPAIVTLSLHPAGEEFPFQALYVPMDVLTVAVPEQLAVPFDAVAEDGALAKLFPKDVMVSAVPPEIVFVPVSATVAAAPLVNVSTHVWPVDPVAVTPLVYVPERRLLRA